MKSFVFVFSLIFFLSPATAQKKNVKKKKKTTDQLVDSRSVEVQSAKAYLEELIQKRYEKELATRVLSDQYEMSVQIQLSEKDTAKRTVANESIDDFELGLLDPDELYERYRESQGRLSHPLAKYMISAVNVSVGLQKSLSEETKANVKNWLGKKVKAEFGTVGKSQVQSIELPVKEIVPPKTPLEWLKELQDFAGLLVLAMAFLFGMLLWLMFGKAKPVTDAPGTDITVNNEMKSEGEREAGAAASVAQANSAASLLLKDEYEEISAKIIDMAKETNKDLSNVIREWCAEGEEGVFRVACLSDVVKADVGRLPIPPDLQSAVFRAFGKMVETDVEKKIEVLNKVYWDLVAVYNLGQDALHRPFSFMSSAPVETVSQVLLEKNSKMRTVVSLFMPNELRKSYIESLDTEMKIEMLEAASELSEISASELESMESQLAPSFLGPADQDSVPLDMTFSKVVDSLSIIEECQLLKKMQGPAIQRFKQTRPSIAFINEWPDEGLSTLFSRVGTEDILGYLSIFTDEKERVMTLVPPKARLVMQDDLDSLDEIPENEVEIRLESLSNAVAAMVEEKEIKLKDVFSTELEEASDAA